MTQRRTDLAAKSPPMNEKAARYLAVESVGSAVVNGILNFAAAFALFHSRSWVPVAGPVGLLRDLIGETFLVTGLSVLVSWLIARRRRRAGTLPVSTHGQSVPRRNLYLWSLIAGLVFTAVCMPCNVLLLPWMFPSGVSIHNVLAFKTLYGAVLGALATFLAVRRALHEVD